MKKKNPKQDVPLQNLADQDGNDPVQEKRVREERRIMPLGSKCFTRPELEQLLMTVANFGGNDRIQMETYESVQRKLDEQFGLDVAKP